MLLIWILILTDVRFGIIVTACNYKYLKIETVSFRGPYLFGWLWNEIMFLHYRVYHLKYSPIILMSLLWSRRRFSTFKSLSTYINKINLYLIEHIFKHMYSNPAGNSYRKHILCETARSVFFIYKYIIWNVRDNIFWTRCYSCYVGSRCYVCYRRDIPKILPDYCILGPMMEHM